LASKIGLFLKWFLDRVFACIWTAKGEINQQPGGMRGAGIDEVKGLKDSVLGFAFSTPCTPGGGGGFNRCAHSAGPESCARRGSERCPGGLGELFGVPGVASGRYRGGLGKHLGRLVCTIAETKTNPQMIRKPSGIRRRPKGGTEGSKTCRKCVHW